MKWATITSDTGGPDGPRRSLGLDLAMGVQQRVGDAFRRPPVFSVAGSLGTHHYQLRSTRQALIGGWRCGVHQNPGGSTRDDVGGRCGGVKPLPVGVGASGSHGVAHLLFAAARLPEDRVNRIACFISLT